MQTNLAPFIRDTAQGREAEAILRACVHCGFCTATCPTYQLLGDELDGPRGRIYQIKDVLEGKSATASARRHLDRCLTCLSCETTCPSGVRYGQLLDIGRDVVERQAPRALLDRLRRTALMAILPHPVWFARLLAAVRALAPLLPAKLRRRVPSRRDPGEWPAARHSRTVLIMDGCVQPALHPGINAACARVLDRLGISAIRTAQGCCGALHHHLSAREAALEQSRQNIDAWWPVIERGVEAILVTASACGLQVKEYARLLADDPAYADKAARVSGLARDPVELLAKEDLTPLAASPGSARSLSVHTPCTLRNGQKLEGRIETLLRGLGYAVTRDPESQLCCGSAGTYSILQPKLSRRLLANKLRALGSGRAEVIATANIGCLVHLQSGTERPVLHWLEVLDRA